jgi:hypothetical protein
MTSIPLREICGVRSGDKGDISDLTLFADDDETYELLLREVTVDRVRDHFGALVNGEIERYEARNVLALKFVLRGALGGGGPRSLRSDNLGKTLGAGLLRLRIDVPDSVLSRSARHGRRAPIER